MVGNSRLNETIASLHTYKAKELKNKKLLNWALELSEYDFDIHHIPSKNNGVSDCLSRISYLAPITNIDTHISLDEFRQSQQTDTDIVNCCKYISSGKKNFDVNSLGKFKRFRKDLNILNGVLMWKDKNVVPPSLYSKVLTICHDHPMSGHFGVQRTHANFKTKYF